MTDTRGKLSNYFDYMIQLFICISVQEIDGPSLLLMKREDVLSALGLKLGPALKLYRKIVRVQQHSQAVS